MTEVMKGLHKKPDGTFEETFIQTDASGNLQTTAAGVGGTGPSAADIGLETNLALKSSPQPVTATALPLPTNAAQESGGNLAAILAKLSADPATQATLNAVLTALNTGVPHTDSAAILAKLSADPATQTTLNAVLTALNTGTAHTDSAAILAKLSADPATQTTLNAVLTALNTGVTHTDLAGIQTTLNSILAEQRDDVFVVSALWEDRSSVVSVFYREERVRSQDDGTTSTIYTNLSTNAIVASLPSGAIPVAGATDRQVEYFRWQTNAAGAGYSVGNWLANTLIADTGGSGEILSSTWFNLSTGLTISAPMGSHLDDPNATLLAQFGKQTDPMATSDTGPFSLVALLKRSLTTLTDIASARLGAGATGIIQPVGGAGLMGFLSSIYDKLTAGTVSVTSNSANPITQAPANVDLLTTASVTTQGQFYIAALDVSQYRSITVQIPANAASFTGNVRVYQSNSNIFAEAVAIAGMGIATLQPSNIIGQTFTSKLCRYPIQAKYLWVEMFSLTAGTAPPLQISAYRDDRTGQETSGRVGITDGNNTAGVKGNGIAPAPSDPALVTTLSPNSPGGSAASPTYSAFAAGVPIALTLVTALNGDLVTNLDISGFSYLTFQVTGVFVGTVSFFQSNDNAAYPSVPGWNDTAQAFSTGASNANLNSIFVLTPRATRLRIRCTAYTSGAITGVLTGHYGLPPAFGGLQENTFTARIPTNSAKAVSGSIPVTLSLDPTTGPTAITATNANLLTGVATANSTVQLTAVNNCTTLQVAITGTWTGALGVQVQIDGTNWTFVDSLIPSAATGTFLFNIPACRNVRVTSVGAWTGTANITMIATIGQAPYSVRTGMTVTNGTITSGGTSQVALGPNFTRKGFEIRNNSAADLWLKVAATPATVAIDNGFLIKAGEVWSPPASAVPPFQAITIFGATTGQKFIIAEYV